MSMIAVIKKLTTDDLGKAGTAFDQGIQKIKDNILNGVVNIESEHVNDKIVVTGIVQNEMNLTAVNNWNSSLYSGISDALEGVQAGGGIVPGSVKGSSILKLANTVASATGYNIAGTGPASKKIYQGSNLSGFSVTLKWYTPKLENWKQQITNITSLAWPVYMGSDADVKTIETNDNNPDKSFKDRILGIADGLGDILRGSLNTLIARNPEKVMLTIYYEKEEGLILYKMTPLIITSFNLQGSRETYGGVPVIVTATINFDYYQINASGGTAEPQIFAGAPIFATPRIKSDGVISGERAQIRQRVNDSLNSAAPASSTSTAFRVPTTPPAYGTSAFGSDIKVIRQ
jgi:hypothetical protein